MIWQRFRLSAMTLVVCYLGYWMYALLLVPWIEPEYPGDLIGDGVPVTDTTYVKPVDELRAELKTWFAPQAWEVKAASKIVRTSQGYLIAQHYENRPDGTVRLWPCSMVFLPGESQEPATNPKQKSKPDAVVLEVPDGALLRFDSPLDLRTGSVGKLLGGKLQGEVIVRSRMREPGEDDDLRIVTREVEVTPTTIRTEHEVRFQWGANYGRGQGMRIELVPDKQASKKQPGVQGVEYVQLLSQVEMFFRLGTKILDAEKPAKTKPKQPPSPSLIRTTSAGPFTFHLLDEQAYFERQVEVARLEDGRPRDTLTCDTLQLLFHQTEVKQPKQSKDAKRTKLEFRELQASGEVVWGHFPDRQLEVKCQILRWTEDTGWLSLRMDPQRANDRLALVEITHVSNEILAPEAHVQWDREQKKLKQALATGPGTLRIRQHKRSIEATWQEKLEVKPDPDEPTLQQLSLLGKARVQSPESGQLLADVIRLWLVDVSKELGKEKDESEQKEFDFMRGQGIRLQTLEAHREVEIRSQVLSGYLDQLSLNFKYLPANQGELPLPKPTEVVRPGSQPRGPAPLQTISHTKNAASRKFDVKARRLTASIQLKANQAAQLTNMQAEGRVRISETDPEEDLDGALVLVGDLLELQNQDPENSIAHLTGSRAKVEGPGLSLEGDTIHVHRGENRLWIDGPGVLTLLVDYSEDRNLKQLHKQPLRITWQGGMHFDGMLARFDREIDARLDRRAVRTDELKVFLTKRIDFANPPQGDDAQGEVDRMTCNGEFFLDSQTHQRGALVSVERMKARELRYDQTSGDVFAQGPGWLTQVKRGNEDLLLDPEGQNRKPPQPGQQPTKPDTSLHFLQVAFAREMNGNFAQRRLQFVGQVETTYGPVLDWEDQIDPRDLTPKAVWMRCEQLNVRQMRQQDKNFAELEALYQVQIEGNEFTAQAVRLSYAQAKDLLLLEGDGTTDARLWRQARPGAPVSRLAARKIFFRRSANHVKLEDVRSGDIEEVSPLRPARPRRE